MLEIKPELKNRIMTHDRAIVAARYLLKQKQVMVVCQGGDVSFWSLEGQKTKRFSEQNATDIFDTTCLGFDEFGEKFYTGGSDGKIRIWNYNGRILQMLDAGRGTAVEITQIDALKRRIVAVGWSKYLTVFRDLQQVEGRPNLPTEWNGEKEKTEGHDDDIVCMAVTAYFPQLLASGSTDGEICIWNTSSELFVRRLDQRKRNPNFSQSKLQDNAADFAISMLKFFDKRMASSVNTHATGANLVSCGGIGFVRFWNVHTGKLIAECQAHTDVSSIIMEIDVHNKYLATGDVNGVVKLWDIEQYCLQSESGTIEKRLPPLLTEFASHSDSITCIDFLEKDERMFILTSSSDCSVVLSDIHGNAYGTFGQPNQWHLDMDLSKLSDSNSQAHLSKSDDYSQQNDEDSHTIISQDLDTMSSITDEEMLTRRSNVWESTSIDLKSAFDERSIFPKYILDYEAKQKQLFESGVQQPTINMVPTGGNNANSQQLARSTGDAVVKFKRQSSSSTLLSDTKAQ
ncbi:unnamed protein product [Rotaria socialis]|uniref:Uncharacterized protein n=1 Tax=Rotaria socialis TaxID=392032 RepID=A0A820A374_9BILA|nr:unnamed protein product [Rotaria socialis]